MMEQPIMNQQILIKELREENATLRTRIAELEDDLAVKVAAIEWALSTSLSSNVAIDVLRARAFPPAEPEYEEVTTWERSCRDDTHFVDATTKPITTKCYYCQVVAKDNGIIVAGNFPSSTGVAVLGELSDHERKGLQLQVSATLAAEISYRHPAKIKKAADSKSVDVECAVFVFNANQLISLVDKCFTESYTAKIEEKVRGGG